MKDPKKVVIYNASQVNAYLTVAINSMTKARVAVTRSATPAIKPFDAVPYFSTSIVEVAQALKQLRRVAKELKAQRTVLAIRANREE